MSAPPGLTYSSDDAPGLRRIAAGKGFAYITAKGKRVRDARMLARIRAIMIPPAWRDVWINANPRGHLQATGRDARERKQYRYHAAFRAHQERQKFQHLAAFATALPDVRRKVAAHLRGKQLTREKVLATVVYLLEATLIRVGNEDYVRANGSFGLTTLRDPHVDVAGAKIRFHFKGKSGKQWRLAFTDRRVAKIVKSCQDLPGQHLFQYRAEDGALCEVTSSDVNAYLRDIAGADITAKEFRTWAGTVMAALALTATGSADSPTAAKKNIRTAMAGVAERLGNTVAVCRTCYVHPAVLDGYLAGTLVLHSGKASRGFAALRPEERAVLTYLKAAARRR